ncbi:MAG: 16S rRNA (cytidine(1402)-2'-O)-methyltransferase [Candidatus Dasytiphilus stammeri]
MWGKLYITPTPIGNLGDITQRALSVLKQVHIIAAENIHHTKCLLNYFHIKTKLMVVHNHNERQQSSNLIKIIQKGHSIALVSNAGTPLINDPGYNLVQNCRDKEISIIVLPGPCAAITALIASGLPTNRFCYEGFLPTRQSARILYLQTLSYETRTIIFYESSQRIIETMQDINLILGSKRIVVIAKEITKTWESIYRSTAGNLLNEMKNNALYYKGELVILVDGLQSSSNKNIHLQQALQTLTCLQKESNISLITAIKIISKMYGISKNKLYQFFLKNINI